MLKRRRYVDNRYLVPGISFLPTSALRKWCRTSMCLELELVIRFCASCTAPWLFSNTGMHGMPTCLHQATWNAEPASKTFYFPKDVSKRHELCLRGGECDIRLSWKTKMHKHPHTSPNPLKLIFCQPPYPHTPPNPMKLIFCQSPSFFTPRQRTPASSAPLL